MHTLTRVNLDHGYRTHAFGPSGTSVPSAILRAQVVFRGVLLHLLAFSSDLKSASEICFLVSRGSLQTTLPQ